MSELTVEKVTPFNRNNFESDGRERSANAVASVTLGIGPLRLAAKLFQRTNDNGLFLGLPGHMTGDNKYFEYVHFRDYNLKKAVEERAIELYRTLN